VTKLPRSRCEFHLGLVRFRGRRECSDHGSASPTSFTVDFWEKLGRTLWYLAEASLFYYSPRTAFRWRNWLLRRFGAHIHPTVRLRRTVTIEVPWHLSIGPDSIIGDYVILYCLGTISIGSRFSPDGGFATSRFFSISDPTSHLARLSQTKDTMPKPIAMVHAGAASVRSSRTNQTPLTDQRSFQKYCIRHESASSGRSATSSASNALHYDAKKPPKTTAPSSLSPSASSWSSLFIRPSDGDLVNPTGSGNASLRI
jgi:hypothetical protein